MVRGRWTWEKHLGIDVAQTTLLHFQAAIFMSEPLKCFIGLEFPDFWKQMQGDLINMTQGWDQQKGTLSDVKDDVQKKNSLIINL